MSIVQREQAHQLADFLLFFVALRLALNSRPVNFTLLWRKRFSLSFSHWEQKREKDITEIGGLSCKRVAQHRLANDERLTPIWSRTGREQKRDNQEEGKSRK